MNVRPTKSGMKRWPGLRLVVMHRRRVLKPFSPMAFDDSCNLLMVDWSEVCIVVEACGDAFSAVKTMFIIKDGLDFYTNKTVGILL